VVLCKWFHFDLFLRWQPRSLWALLFVLLFLCFYFLSKTTWFVTKFCNFMTQYNVTLFSILNSLQDLWPIKHLFPHPCIAVWRFGKPYCLVNYPLLTPSSLPLGLPETEKLDDCIPVEKPFVARFKNWGNFMYDWPGHGKRVRTICIFGVRDVPLLVQRKELFANKFHLDFHPLALDCLKEWHYNRTRDQYMGRVGFDVRWYDQLGFTRNKVE